MEALLVGCQETWYAFRTEPFHNHIHGRAVCISVCFRGPNSTFYTRFGWRRPRRGPRVIGGNGAVPRRCCTCRSLGPPVQLDHFTGRPVRSFWTERLLEDTRTHARTHTRAQCFTEAASFTPATRIKSFIRFIFTLGYKWAECLNKNEYIILSHFECSMLDVLGPNDGRKTFFFSFAVLDYALKIINNLEF